MLHRLNGRTKPYPGSFKGQYRPPSELYVCERCGAEKPYKRGRPTLCRDCRSVDPHWQGVER